MEQCKSVMERTGDAYRVSDCDKNGNLQSDKARRENTKIWQWLGLGGARCFSNEFRAHVF